MMEVAGTAVIAGMLSAGVIVIAKYKWKGFYAILALIALVALFDF